LKEGSTITITFVTTGNQPPQKVTLSVIACFAPSTATTIVSSSTAPITVSGPTPTLTISSTSSGTSRTQGIVYKAVDIRHWLKTLLINTVTGFRLYKWTNLSASIKTQHAERDIHDIDNITAEIAGSCDQMQIKSTPFSTASSESEESRASTRPTTKSTRSSSASETGFTTSQPFTTTMVCPLTEGMTSPQYLGSPQLTGAKTGTVPSDLKPGSLGVTFTTPDAKVVIPLATGITPIL
ncbi:unnamed protein product, partial [Rotaria socialis]